jgi:chemotaxis protein methyltransferase CheR
MSVSGAQTEKRPADIAQGREFAFTAEDFRQIADLVHSNTGIRMPEYKSAMVYSRLAKRLRALGLDSFREYCRLVVDNTGVDERQKMLAALTTNMTSFFREPHHFEHLRQKMLPPLLDAARRGGRVRIWSAGCSSGEEPYSIALTILALLPEAAQHDIKVLATDINPGVLDKGRRGIYPESALRPVSAELKRRWFQPAPVVDGEPVLAASEQLRSLIAFRELNLVGDWPMRGTFQAIFCRNVVIYFEETTRDRIWARFIPLMAPGACLYIGHSERLGPSVAPHFGQEEFTTYRLVGGER